MTRADRVVGATVLDRVFPPPDDGPDDLRAAARDVRERVLAHLPETLELFAERATKRGTEVYWASSAVEARDYVRRVVRSHDVERVVAHPSRVVDDIELVPALEARGVEVVVGTDLLGRAAVDAPMGITGADLAVADTGSVVLVTGGGGGRLAAALPRVQVVLLAMERLTAYWHQADLLLALLARSAPAGSVSMASTTVLSGPRGHDESDGPDELHVVVIDNGRDGLWSGAHGSAGGCACCGAHHASSEGWAAGWPPLAEPGERAAWHLWAAAWSDALRYAATTRAATWSRLAGGLGGRLPAAVGWTRGGPDLADGPPDRFRDRWRKGLV